MASKFHSPFVRRVSLTLPFIMLLWLVCRPKSRLTDIFFFIILFYLFFMKIYSILFIYFFIYCHAWMVWTSLYILFSLNKLDIYFFSSPAALLVENGKFLLSAKRTRRTTCTEYVISMDADNISRSSSTYIGKLR